MPGKSPAQRPEWQKLSAHYRAGQPFSTAQAFKNDPERSTHFSLFDNGFLFDFSRHPVTDETIRLLTDLATACDVTGWRDAMFAGKPVNSTENRAALHTALRRPVSDTVMVDSDNIMPSIHETLARMKRFSDAVRDGSWKGHTGKPIRSVVHIGIGGSDLGPRMVCRALSAVSHPNISLHFVSNVDGAAIHSALNQCDPETTLFIVASKTFTTQETMANAQAARAWLLNSLPTAAVAAHFVALSANLPAVMEFGIAKENMFAFGEWVGGRYSVWSAIGLPVCIAAGFDVFHAFLEGARAMDRHFQTMPLDKNIPVIMALLGIWQRNFCGADTHAIIPYDDRLSLLPAYLQQLDMESNGKSADRDGHRINDYKTAPVVFGSAGTDAQHSYFQLLHQGTDIVPVDMIAACNADNPYKNHHNLLLANMMAQAQAFTNGRDDTAAGDSATHVFMGRRPVNIFMIDTLTPFHLGQLLAAYEHKIFVQGVIWNINSFDQFGVELGKEIAGRIISGDRDALDSGTLFLMNHIQNRKV
jgi:glucose-6-phosphate isomerase